MNDREISKLLETVRLITKDIVSSEQLSAREEKYRKYESVSHAISKLVMLTHNLYLHDDVLKNYYFEYIRNNFSTPFKNTTEMKLSIQKTLTHNHQLVDSAIVEICNTLNTLNVDYYLIGAVPCYIAARHPFIRCHDDIDIILNEDDSEKVKMIFQTTDYDFCDKRHNNINYFDSTAGKIRGEHELIAYHENYKFHIGFYLFVRGKNDEIITRGYFQSIENCEKITMICDRASVLEYTKLNYNETPIQYKETSFRMESLEGIYNSKNREKYNPGREKDYYDIAMLEKSGMLNYQKTKQLEVFWDKIEPKIYSVEVIAKPLGTRAARPQILEKCGQYARVPRQNRRFCNYL